MAKILCIEDDPTTADYIAKGLGEAGFTVDIAADGRDGLFQASDGSYDAIVLDRMLPGMDGLAVLSALRAAGVVTPVVMLSALASLDERVRGLRAGSDDYLGKPFALAELLARIEAVRRRSQAAAGGDAPVTRLAHGDLEVDLLSRRVTRAGRRIEIQPREFRLLEFLLRHAGQVVTRTMLLEGVWDYHFDPGTNVIDVHVSRLRKKLDDGGAASLLHTVRGAGYRLGEA
ncbi:DNA-binding response regulator [Polymorphobacter glacialis]|uniref:DNA-binding response regulator n=1 Tax=Sandarakinorhabdus glacialis TaxID=1614636 RepID=A0A917E5B6_9SPHN|nr:response regulator transcription factor [Polymorphobacter glacialis]GGE05909.1 DNA-binding response regulator [Polymorphobacter glacialis]